MLLLGSMVTPLVLLAKIALSKLGHCKHLLLPRKKIKNLVFPPVTFLLLMEHKQINKIN